MKNIAILGAGWLGTALAKKLQLNHQVKVSTRTVEKQVILTQEHLNTFIVDLDTPDNFNSFFNDVDVLIISLTPQPIAIFRKIETFIKTHQIKHVLLFSSTGIYNDLEGVVTEISDLNIHLPRVALLKEIEDVFLENTSFKATILRLGGLIGPNRHPVNSLAKKERIADGNEPINIAYQKTIITYIEFLLTQELPNSIFNIVEDDHRSKQTYYTEAAEILNLKLPKFIFNEQPKNRIVSAQKIKEYIKK